MIGFYVYVLKSNIIEICIVKIASIYRSTIIFNAFFMAYALGVHGLMRLTMFVSFINV